MSHAPSEKFSAFMRRSFLSSHAAPRRVAILVLMVHTMCHPKKHRRRAVLDKHHNNQPLNLVALLSDTPLTQERTNHPLKLCAGRVGAI